MFNDALDIWSIILNTMKLLNSMSYITGNHCIYDIYKNWKRDMYFQNLMNIVNRRSSITRHSIILTFYI